MTKDLLGGVDGGLAWPRPAAGRNWILPCGSRIRTCSCTGAWNGNWRWSVQQVMRCFRSANGRIKAATLWKSVEKSTGIARWTFSRGFELTCWQVRRLERLCLRHGSATNIYNKINSSVRYGRPRVDSWGSVAFVLTRFFFSSSWTNDVSNYLQLFRWNWLYVNRVDISFVSSSVQYESGPLSDNVECDTQKKTCDKVSG